MKSGQKIAIARRCLAAVAHACRAMCAGCGGLRRLANAPRPAKLSDCPRLGPCGRPLPLYASSRRSLVEGVGWFREAAKTLQERRGFIERIADRACLAKIKRQRIFNHDANSSRPTCFGARAEGCSKRCCDAVD